MATWTIHQDPESVEWRRRLAEHYPLVPNHRLLRLCLRYGLRNAAMHPELVVEEAAGDGAADDVAHEVQP